MNAQEWKEKSRKKAEETLIAKERHLDLALTGADLGTWEWNVRSGQFKPDSQTRHMLGYSAMSRETKRMTWLRRVHPEDRRPLREAFYRHALGSDVGYEMEFRIGIQPGEWKWLLARGRVFEWDSKGNPV